MYNIDFEIPLTISGKDNWWSISGISYTKYIVYFNSPGIWKQPDCAITIWN